MNKLSYYLIVSIALIGTFAACTSKGEEKDDITVDQEDINQSLNTNFDGKIFSIPSPILTMLLIKKVSSDFHSEYLNPTSNYDSYQTEHKRALILGVYSADLGYSSIYKEKSKIMDYLVTVEKLANSLGLDASFDKSFIDRYQKNTDNSDSMMHIVSDAFKNADLFLKNGDRKSVSALILAGAWTESMHFATSLALKHKNQELTERIGEQKKTLETLISLLEVNNKQSQNDELLDQYKELSKLFEKIKMNYEFQEPETNADAKITTLKHHVSYEISPSDFEEIQQSIAAIRNQIIK